MAVLSDEAVEKIGSFGRFQLRITLIASYAIFFNTAVLMVMTFSTAEPPWRCTANSSSCMLNGTFKAGDKHYKHRCGIPRKDWEFAVEGDFDSIVTEWDLVCEKATLTSLVNSLIFIVWIFGSLVSSVLSDKYGRKAVIFPCSFFTCICALVSAFAQRYWVFALFRSLAGIGIGGYSAPAFVLVTEYVGVRHRSAVGFGIWFAWVISLMILSLLGYLIQSWRTLSIIISAPGLLFFLFWWATPESLRWLMTKEKIEEARKILKTAARVNKVKIDDDDLSLLKISEKEEEKKKKHKEETRMGDFRDLFISRVLARRTLLSWYCWFVCGLVYYGIMFSSPTIGGNMYLNFFIATLCEAVGMVIGIHLFNRFGRRKSIVGSLWVAGIAAVTAAILSQYEDGSDGYLVGKILTSMVVGKLFITIAFDGMYIYTTELFPTVVRNTAMGSSSAAARVGSACSPYIVYSQRVHPLMPFGIMAINALICGILCMTLPETRDRAMLDTIKQDFINSQDSGIEAINGGSAEKDGEKTKLAPSCIMLESAA